MKIEFDLHNTDLLGSKDWSRIHELVQKFDPEEFGVSCPSASVYGAAHAKSHTLLNIKSALRIAFTNFGLIWDIWKIEIEPIGNIEELKGERGDTFFKYLTWKVRIQPLTNRKA